MVNVSYIYQPHFKTSCFRVACEKQQGQIINYIVVTCSPSYNGVYSWDPKNKGDYNLWSNNGLLCYEVPILDCNKVKELSEVVNPEAIKNIKKQQKKWFEGQVLNGKAYKTDKPDWML